MASDRASHPPSNRCAFNPFPASPQYHLIYPQLSVPEHSIAPKVYLAAASPRASLPCAPQSVPRLCTPEYPCSAYSRAYFPCVPQCVPVHPTTTHPCTHQRIPENPAALHRNPPPASGAFAGFWNVTLIPEGARHIRVAQRSHNHLGTSGPLGKLRLGLGDRRFSRAQAD